MTLPLETQEKLPKRTTPDKITVVESIYHSSESGEPVSTQKGFDRILNNQGLQVYKRRNLEIDDNESRIDTGWLKDNQCGVIHIENLSRSSLRYTSNPDERAKKQEDDNTIELSFRDPRFCLLIPPNSAQRVEVNEVKALRIKCRKGRVKINLSIYPN